MDINSLELMRPRSIGVEHVGLEAPEWLQLPDILKENGMNGRQLAVALGAIIGRVARPVSELATWRWLQSESGLGELLSFDYETLPLITMYRVFDQLVRHRKQIKEALFSRITNLFSLPATVTLYDLTNTFFEGAAAGNPKAKRNDCPLVTLGLVLDGSGFVRCSRMFEGNVVESTTLESMFTAQDAPAGAMV